MVVRDLAITSSHKFLVYLNWFFSQHSEVNVAAIRAEVLEVVGDWAREGPDWRRAGAAESDPHSTLVPGPPRMQGLPPDLSCILAPPPSPAYLVGQEVEAGIISVYF